MSLLNTTSSSPSIYSKEHHQAGKSKGLVSWLRLLALLTLVLGACQDPAIVSIEGPRFCKQLADCKVGERCVNLLCVSKGQEYCGNGLCDKEEDCQSCPQDCSCNTCGNGLCETDKKESCGNCPVDCLCPAGQKCDTKNGSCISGCGNGVCEASLREDCLTCPGDCKCNAESRCVQGGCLRSCGNGACEPQLGEDCVSCTQDCPCPEGLECKAGSCGSLCGNGTCDSGKGENCATCSKDCVCGAGQYCDSGNCSPWCGNGICDRGQGENCRICADCKCPSSHFCEPKEGKCLLLCGNGTCDSGKGENCATCLSDCPCAAGKSCVNGACNCVPQCSGKNCGDDGCGGMCGTCPGSMTCSASGVCECQHACTKVGDSTCVSADEFERCELDGQGCRVLKKTRCTGGKCDSSTGLCCGSCQGKQCGSDGCGGDCGSCSSLSDCVNQQCVCKNKCSKLGDKKCEDSDSYEECVADGAGCLFWSSEKKCGQGQTCQNGRCCNPQCSGKECGDDGCGGTCGSCGGGQCKNGLCSRTLTVTDVELPCGLCFDLDGSGPDLYFYLLLNDGKTSFSSKNAGSNFKKDANCKNKISFNWQVPDLDPRLLNNAQLYLRDDEGRFGYTTCLLWIRDFSQVGTKTHTLSNRRNAKVTVTVSR